MLLAAAATLTTAAALAVDQPNPGLYEVKTRTEYSELPMPPTTLTTRNCLTQDDLDRDPQSIFAALPAEENCSVDEFTMADGQISMKLTCLTAEGNMTMRTSGAYTATNYNMASNVLIEVGDKKMTMTSEISGARVGDCDDGAASP